MALITDDQLSAFLSGHSAWAHEADSVVRTFEFGDFVESMAFVTAVALAAETAAHHPDIDIRWNKVTLRLSTHSEGGLTDKDTDLAGRIDGFA